MASITTRAGKGTPLTNAEVDANFTNLNTELVSKQDALVSGTNIKTVNGSSLLGAGNVVVSDATKLPLAGGTMTGAISFAAGQTWPTFNQNTTGSAATLTTARTINEVSFNGSANVTVPRVRAIDDRTSAPLDTTAAYATFAFGSWANNSTAPYADNWIMRSYTDSSGGNDNMVSFRKDAIGMRIWQQAFGSSAAFATYVDVLHSGNYNSYAPTLTGTGASGTWPISIAGNAASAASAATLTTARNINGVSFNGSADITIADATKLPLIGGTMTGAITFAGAQTWPTFNQNTTGSAATLTTGRTIAMTGDVTWTSPSFNGSANVTAAATLANSGVTAGTYTKVTVDAKGRVTTGASLAAGDVPTLNQNTTGTAANVTDIVALANGGTGAATANAGLNNLQGYTTTATAAGTTTLTAASSFKQYFTGTTTQTVVMPDVTTLALGRSHEIINNSTGTVTVQSSGLNTITTIPSGISGVVTCIAITGATAASWHYEFASFDTITGSGACVFATSPTLVTPNIGVATGTSFNSITALSSTTPVVAGTAAIGTATTVARADHVHPAQTTITGNAGTATTLATGRTIAMTGDVTYTSPSFNGSANVTAAATLATVNANVGAFGSSTAIPVVTVNAKGLVTAVTTANVAGGQYFGTAATKAIAYNANTIAENVTITAGNNGLSAGPITINTGFAVTVATGASWSIV